MSHCCPFSPPLPDDQEQILWCELLDLGESVTEDWNGENDDYEEVTTEQLIQGVARKENERGANVHEKSPIWAAKDTEWKKLDEKETVRILTGDSAEKTKVQFSNRFIPSRFVVNRPSPDEFKARRCLQGYLDPDVMELVGSGSTQSPTVSQLGRMLSCQMIVSNGWNLQLRAVWGAFLEADALDRMQGPLYSSLPPGGTAGVPDGSVILILGNIYGLNDAPQRWWKKFDAVMTSIGFFRSTFDVCVYALKGTVGNLEGIFCVHVDDTNCGGSGSMFSKALTALRHRFPFRKWQFWEGTFCGSKYVQNKDTKEIMISQTEFAVKVTKVPMSPARKKTREDLADKADIHTFRGEWKHQLVGWSNASRCVLVKCLNCCRLLPQPSSVVVRRVHQHADLGLKIRGMPVQQMMLPLHVDPTLHTGGLVGSQGGYICGVTVKSLLEGKDAPWSPMAWRSFKMSRTVPNSLSAEAHAMSVALGFVEWATLFLQELIHGRFDLQSAPAVMQERPPVCVTDCKSLYDHVSAVGSPSTLQDKRSAIDVLIFRESLKKTGCVTRWAPTGLQLADGLTKDEEEAVECLHRSLRFGSYMLWCEEQVMQERHLTRSELADSNREESASGTLLMRPAGGTVLVGCCVVLFRVFLDGRCLFLWCYQC